MGIRNRQASEWFIVCDGMGGQPGGREAAKICANTLHQFITTAIHDDHYINGSALIKRGMVEVAEKIQLHVLKSSGHLFMGTTICGLLTYKGETIAFWSGDSRIFQYRHSKCIWSNAPHNPVFDQWRNGDLRRSDAERHKSSILTNYIDASKCFPIVEVEVLTLKSQDRVLICTDGIWNAFTRKELRALITDGGLYKTEAKIKAQMTVRASDNYFGWVFSWK